MKTKTPFHLDDGKFPHENYMRNVARGRRAEQKFGSPAITAQRAKEVYNVVQEMNSLNEPTLAYKSNRRFI